jgi:hypothetical protein
MYLLSFFDSREKDFSNGSVILFIVRSEILFKYHFLDLIILSLLIIPTLIIHISNNISIQIINNLKINLQK